MEIEATGVAIRSATDDEVLAYRRARAGGEFEGWLVTGSLASGDLHVVAHAFVEFRRDGAHERWEATARHGLTVPLDRDATSELLAAAREAREGLIDLLGDMGIGGMHVTRWALLSAPHRIELDPALRERLSLR
jgi:hypothetical protein